MKNSNDTIGNRTRDLPACSAVPQPTAPPRAPKIYTVISKYLRPSMEFASCRSSEATNFRVAPRFLENLYTRAAVEQEDE